MHMGGNLHSGRSKEKLHECLDRCRGGELQEASRHFSRVFLQDGVCGKGLIGLRKVPPDVVIGDQSAPLEVGVLFNWSWY